MTRRNLLWGIGAVVLLGVVGGVIFLVLVYLPAGSGEASAPISAPTLSAAEASAGSEGEATPAGDEAEAGADEEATPAAEQAQPAAGDAGSTAGEAPAAGADATLFRISAEESEVRFTIDELLFGQPNTVVGRTDQVAGDLLVNLADPARSQVGTVRVNVRTLLTDNEFRNRAIRSRILESAQDEYEFAEFAPTALIGLPERVAVGDEVTFQIVGNLTVHGQTHEETFAVTATLVSATRLEGSASTTVMRANYNLTIPDVPGVAGVTEEVGLAIDFVALAVEG